MHLAAVKSTATGAILLQLAQLVAVYVNFGPFGTISCVEHHQACTTRSSPLDLLGAQEVQQLAQRVGDIAALNLAVCSPFYSEMLTEE